MSVTFAALSAAVNRIGCSASRIATAVAVSLPALASAPALASETADSAFENEATPTIIVTGSSGNEDGLGEVEATPGGADYVPYQDYADRTAVSLRDALALSPGVYTQPRYGQEIRLSIRGSGISRGFHMRGIALLQNGVPINLADDNGDFQELEPIFFDHLEIYRGANALRYGSGTLGGAINGVTPTGDQAKGLYARIDGGTYDFFRGLVSAGFGGERSNAWIAAGADYGQGDREHAARNSQRFQGNAGFKLNDRISTRFYASLNRIRQELPGALTEEVALSRPATGNTFGDQQRDIDSLRLQNRTSVDLGSTQIVAGTFVNAKSLYHPIFQVIDQKSVDYGGFARIEHASGPFSLTLGGEIRRGANHARQFINVNGKRGRMTFDADQDARTLNAYGEARFTPLTGVSLIAGGIYTDGWRDRTVNYSTNPAQNGRISLDEFSPRFGILLEPDANVQFYANYSKSAELPGFGEAFQTVAGTSTFISDIHEQTAWTAEVGTRGAAGWISWDISIYRARLKGEMLQYSISSDVPAATFNAGRTIHQGVELGVTVQPEDWLRLQQTWLYSDFHFDNDNQFGDNTLPVVPKHVLRSDLRVGTDGLHISPNVEWVPTGAWADYGNTTKTPGYALIGLTAGATVASGIDVFLDARNLTGKKAIGDVSATLVALDTSAIYYPVERRAVYGGVRARF